MSEKQTKDCPTVKVKDNICTLVIRRRLVAYMYVNIINMYCLLFAHILMVLFGCHSVNGTVGPRMNCPVDVYLFFLHDSGVDK